MCSSDLIALLRGAELERTIVVIEIIVGVISGNINAIAINIPSTITALRSSPSEAGTVVGSGQIPSVIRNVILVTSVCRQGDLWDGRSWSHREAIVSGGHIQRSGGDGRAVVMRRHHKGRTIEVAHDIITCSCGHH